MSDNNAWTTMPPLSLVPDSRKRWKSVALQQRFQQELWRQPKGRQFAEPSFFFAGLPISCNALFCPWHSSYLSPFDNEQDCSFEEADGNRPFVNPFHSSSQSFESSALSFSFIESENVLLRSLFGNVFVPFFYDNLECWTIKEVFIGGTSPKLRFHYLKERPCGIP